MREIIITPETHWDREWYLPFQGYRARLVNLLDRLLAILDTDPDYQNFTLDGQTVVLEDYVEVRPRRQADLERHVRAGRLSVGPFYVLPDEFLVSGEALVRNLLVGHQIAEAYGRVMRAGYIPDPFGHVAQLPQILAGFDVPSVLFMRGFGNEWAECELGMEFTWQAPGRAAEVLAVYLVEGYSSAADLPMTYRDAEGRLATALYRLENKVAKLARHATTDTVLLNNGTDHRYAQPEISSLVKQWNAEHDDSVMINADFEAYVARVVAKDPTLGTFQGELRGGCYYPLLAGTFSARMWIKQANFRCQAAFEKYAEPAATLAALANPDYEYPAGYLRTGWKWLLKNHPHDSICGASIDQVHEEMRTRFNWAEGIAEEIFKEAALAFISRMERAEGAGDEYFEVVAFNPHPWPVTSPLSFQVVFNDARSPLNPASFVLRRVDGTEVPGQARAVSSRDYHHPLGSAAREIRVLARDLPPLGYRRYRLYPFEEPRATAGGVVVTPEEYLSENEFYRVQLAADGTLRVEDKDTGERYEKLGFFVDEGDWGDEYDYSGPPDPTTSHAVASTNPEVAEVRREVRSAGPVTGTLGLTLTLKVPARLADDRATRGDDRVTIPVDVEVSLHQGVKRVDYRVHLDNRARDHRLRACFPTGIHAAVVNADGHFLVVDRAVDPPDDAEWVQKYLPHNHQAKFVNVESRAARRGLAVLNRGLPEYEAVRTPDGTICLAVTLLRCVGWLSRPDLASRDGNAGPAIATPGAQCVGPFSCEFALTTHDGDWRAARLQDRADAYCTPPRAVVPASIDTFSRAVDKLFFGGMEYLPLAAVAEARDLPAEVAGLTRESSPHVHLSALKRADDGSGYILRAWNDADDIETCQIRFFRPVQVAQVANLRERRAGVALPPASEIHVTNSKLVLQLGPHVILAVWFMLVEHTNPR